MKAKIYYIFILVVVCLTTLVLQSCSNDKGYDLGKFYVVLATVTPLDNGEEAYYLTMDDGSTLYPVASTTNYKPKKNQRVWVNFTPLSDKLSGYDHYAKINGIRDVLTKNIVALTADNELEIGNDPIELLQYWVGDNYLNIHFGYNTGGEKQHSINLVENKITNQPTLSRDTITVELRHNRNGDPENYKAKNYVAFDLRQLQQEGTTSINLVFKIQGFNNEKKEYSITYNYGNANKNLFDNEGLRGLSDTFSLNRNASSDYVE
jgi:hypothetical protein